MSLGPVSLSGPFSLFKLFSFSKVRRSRPHRMLAALAFIAALFVASSVALHAQTTFIVTLTTDPDTGVYANCTSQTAGTNGTDTACSLRDAFAAVDHAAPTGTTQPLIQISPLLYSAGSPATITLTQTTASAWPTTSTSPCRSTGRRRNSPSAATAPTASSPRPARAPTAPSPA